MVQPLVMRRVAAPIAVLALAAGAVFAQQPAKPAAQPDGNGAGPQARDLHANLLLADQGHIPYFVYSKPLHVTVTKQRTDVKADQVQGPRKVQVLAPADGMAVRGAFRVQFHASGYNVSHVGAKVPDTGYFRLTAERAGVKPEVFAFRDGQTEVWLEPPTGDYTLKLDLVAGEGGAVMASATPVRIKAESYKMTPVTAGGPTRKVQVSAPN